MKEEKHLYWTKTEEILCAKLYVALKEKNEKEIRRLFGRIQGKLRWMIRSILLRYFRNSYNFSETPIIINDVLTFIILKFLYFDFSRNRTFYSFFSNLIKNQIHHIVIGGYEESVDRLRLPKDRGLLCGDEVDFESYTSPTPEISIRSILFLKLKKYKQIKINELNALEKKYQKRKKRREIDIVEMVEEIIREFDGNLSTIEISGVAQDRYGVKPSEISSVFPNSMIFTYPRERKGEKKYNPDDIYDLDFTPIEKKYTQKQKKNKIKKKLSQYEN